MRPRWSSPRSPVSPGSSAATSGVGPSSGRTRNRPPTPPPTPTSLTDSASRSTDVQSPAGQRGRQALGGAGRRGGVPHTYTPAAGHRYPDARYPTPSCGADAGPPRLGGIMARIQPPDCHVVPRATTSTVQPLNDAFVIRAPLLVLAGDAGARVGADAVV